jgi:hypothetical protein
MGFSKKGTGGWPEGGEKPPAKTIAAKPPGVWVRLPSFKTKLRFGLLAATNAWLLGGTVSRGNSPHEAGKYLYIGSKGPKQ